MLGLGWFPADPITAESSFLIAYSVLLDRPYAEAPVSDLFVFGRNQDLAFQKPVGEAPAAATTSGSGIPRNSAEAGSPCGSGP